MEYQPGDVVNGYVLGEDNQWHPVPPGWAPAGEQPPAGPATPTQQSGPAGAVPTPGASPWAQQPGPGGPAPGAGQWQAQPVPGGPPQGPGKPPGPIYKRWWFWVTAGLLVVVVGVITLAALVIGRAVETATSAASTTTGPRITIPTQSPTFPRRTPNSTPTSVVTSGGQIGQPVRDEELEVTVTSVECGVPEVGGGMFGATATGSFCLVHIKVTNVGTAPSSLLEPLQKAVDSQGRELPLDMGAQLRLGSSNQISGDIAPGASAGGALVFDVPAGASLASLKVQTSFTSKGATIALS